LGLGPHSVRGELEGDAMGLTEGVPSHAPHEGRQLPGLQCRGADPQKPERLQRKKAGHSGIPYYHTGACTEYW
jgi:hypothetical protein